jgi:lipopolysaccharide/colanic/teichoic acid biosynthesis glycosyltransferase
MQRTRLVCFGSGSPSKKVQGSPSRERARRPLRLVYNEPAKRRGRDRDFALRAKRAIDVAGSIALLLLSLPILLLAALAIRIDSRGPVLFRQARVGQGGRPFPMWKLRSMVEGAEDQRGGLLAHNEMDGPVFKMRRDPRVTRVGRVLRRFSIDELPQLWNVLRGDMSLVGPRPPLPCEVAKYGLFERRRLSVKPGLTCEWQVSGRNEIGFDEWMRLDVAYAENWSLRRDLWLLLRTLPAVARGTGA